MAKLPEQLKDAPTVQAIYQAYERANEPRRQRRIGAASIGQECARRTWYDLRWAGSTDGGFGGRMLRLFETGHLAEPRFVANLTAIGCEVFEVDPVTKEQFTYTACDGHFVCKIDGVVRGIPEAPKAWHVAEFKTHSSKSFREVKKKGVRNSKPQHYAQLMIGMHLSNGIDRGLYLAVNKDTDELYAERIHYNEEEASNLIALAQSVIDSGRAPDRAANDMDKPPCVWCPHKSVCWGSVPPQPAIQADATCRSCCHSTPVSDGRWKCEKKDAILSQVEQERGCDDHLFLPDFIAFAHVDDAEEKAIAYVSTDGTAWRNGKGLASDFSSKELTVLPWPMIGQPHIAAAKAELGGTVVDEDEVFA